MKRATIWAILSALMLFVGFTSALAADEPAKPPAQPAAQAQLPAKENLTDWLQEISVTIRSGWAEGSGTLVVRGDKTFILTAGHVIDDLRETREVIDPRSGGKKTVIEFRSAKVVTILREQGESVGRVELDASVVTYSDSEYGEDLALLLLKKRNYAKKGAVFYKASKEQPFPPVGTDVYHVGSLHGEFGSNSLVDGIVSQVGRVYQKKVYDQTNVNAFPGSSGGGVYIKDDGRYCGMIVRGTYGGFNLMVPMRRINDWAKRMKIEWVLDPSLPVPTDEELLKIPVEDTGFPIAADKKEGANPHSRVATKDRVGFFLRPLTTERTETAPQRTEAAPAIPTDPLILRVIREIKK